MTLEQVLDLAMQHHQRGQLAEAEALYRQVLAAQPNQPDALHLLGMIALQVNRPETALELIRKAIEVHPGVAQFYCNLGQAYQMLNRVAEATGAFRQAVVLRPDYPEANYNLGTILQKQGSHEEAVAALSKAIASRSGYAVAYNNLGNSLRALNRLEEAARAFEEALRIKPDFAEAAANLRNLLQFNGQFEPAVAAYRIALKSTPDSPDALNNLGLALKELDQYDESIALLRLAVSLRPNSAELLANLGVVQNEFGLGDDALNALNRSLDLRADHADTHLNVAKVHMMGGCVEAAMASLDAAIAIEPDHAVAHFHRGVALLLSGNFEGGWPEYAWRWKTREVKSWMRNFPQPRWDGGELSGKTILIHPEQGFGDMLQFCRYSPLVARKTGGRVILECQPELAPLLGSLPDVAQVVPRGQPLPGFDVQCPLLDLPAIFHTNLDSIPAEVPYIRADTEKSKVWQCRLKPDRLKVGLAWTGRPHFVNDRVRSLKLSAFAPLAEIEGIEFHSLQKGDSFRQIPESRRAIDVKDWSDELTDFSDTAALIANLDLVIAVDTAVAHLAGAMGRSVWVLLPYAPDWRWMLSRADSPWYPTMRLFRQQRPGDWTTPLSQIVDALHELGK